MKKVLLIMLMILCCCNSAFAEKREWVDKNFDFKKVNSIFFVVDYEPDKDGISENEVWEIFTEEFRDIQDTFAKHDILFANTAAVVQQVGLVHDIDMVSLAQNDPGKFNSLVVDFIKENFDLGIKITVLVYETGSQYFEGYTINVPDTETSQVFTPYGTATVYTNKTKQQYISGGNAPVAYCAVSFVATNVKNNKNVWNRIDDRARANRSIIENSKPKDLYTRIMSSYLSDLEKKLKR